MRIIILGCGPAGLLSAYACEERGHYVEAILSKKAKSEIPGAVFLHEPIPALTARTPDAMVNFVKIGNKLGYAQKVYGHEDADCSWDLFPEGERPGWSMFKLYNNLWTMYHSSIHDYDIATGDVRSIAQDAELVISTIPTNHLCLRPHHKFASQDIYILDKPVDGSLENAIVYNGSPYDDWYRTSNIFGHGATESVKPFQCKLVNELGAKVRTGFKPLFTTCDCHPGVERVGRFGSWKKGILVHHAYKQTIELLEKHEMLRLS